ncbi:MAG: UDP-galactopyranose mutase, partial [Thermoanaerobaculaceae bacterium]
KEAEPDLQRLADFVYEKIGLYAQAMGATSRRIGPLCYRARAGAGELRRSGLSQPRPCQEKALPPWCRKCWTTITLLLGTSWQEIQEDISSSILIYTGPIDEFFADRFGVLAYRSLRFHHETLALAQYQRVGQVNFPFLNEYTRIVEFKHLTGQHYLPHTTISFEFPEDFVPGKNEPYYPVPTAASTNLYARYLEAAKECKNVYFAGRLGDYRYYNLDQAVARALKLFTHLAKGCAP